MLMNDRYLFQSCTNLLSICQLGSEMPEKKTSATLSELQERVYDRGLDRCGAVHITIGDGGNREGLAQRFRNPKPEWSVFREASFGHGELRVANATHAFWSWHRNDDDEPVQSDGTWINSLISTGCVCEDRRRKKILLAS